MHITHTWIGAAALTIMTTLPAAAGNIYPVHTSHNFCPAGLQPVTMDGTICCGTPNQSVRYQSMMAQGSTKHRPRAQQSDCPIGEKGCR